MSAVEEITRRIERAGVEACAAQWAALQNRGQPIAARCAESIVDIEALILFSLYLGEHDHRLRQDLEWFATVGSTLVSFQRTRTLLKHFPADTANDVHWFANLCHAHGDRRWKPLICDEPRQEHTGWSRAGKDPEQLRLLSPATLMLRLRAGFGVGAKADMMTFLLGVGRTTGAWRTNATAEVIARGVSYSAASIRRAATEMALAGLVDASWDRPTTYEVDAAPWAGLLGHEVPPWRFWSQLFAMLAHTMFWAKSSAEASPVVQASRARDLFERYRRPLRWIEMALPDPGDHPGPAFLDAYRQTIDLVCGFIETRT